MKCLIVDDDKDVLDSLIEILESENYTTEGKTDSKIALELMKKENYDIIFLDLTMPGMSGYELLKELNNFDKAKSKNVVVYTGTDLTPDETDDLLNFNIKGIIKKPFSIDDIINICNKF